MTDRYYNDDKGSIKFAREALYNREVPYDNESHYIYDVAMATEDIKKQTTKEYKINEFITLKLENGRTNIYVDGNLFNQCKYILLNLENKDFPEYNEIESMDEAIEMYSKKNEVDKTILDKDTEFMGHCSNIQAWAENDYNLNILHSSLSFPLLGALVNAGDKTALIALKEEIIERINSKNEKVIRYFLNENYLQLFTYEELNVVFEEIDIENQDILHTINKLMNRKYVIDKLKKRGHIHIKFETRTT